MNYSDKYLTVSASLRLRVTMTRAVEILVKEKTTFGHGTFSSVVSGYLFSSF